LFIPSIENPFYVEDELGNTITLFKVSGFIVNDSQSAYIHFHLLQADSSTYKWVGTGYSPVS
jgi:hypothetical protein